RPSRTAMLVESRLEQRLLLRGLGGEQSAAVSKTGARPGDLGCGSERRKLIQPDAGLSLLVGADGGFYAIERRENGDHGMLDRLELRKCRRRMAKPEVECSEHPSGRVIDQSDRLSR